MKNAVDTILLTRESIRNNPFVFISADKGNKKGNKNLAKYLCWYCVKDRRVKTYLLDVDCSDENSEDVAIAIKHSLLRMFGTTGIVLVLFGQCTDSGGGGTGKSLFRELLKLGLTSPIYLMTSCALHNLQTALRNGIQLVLGEGGLEDDGKGKRNAMQLLHGAYNIQNWCENDELKEIYLYTREQEGLEMKFKKLEEPIVTRWWLVGACATSFLACLSTWTRICDGIRKSAPTSSASYKVAAATLSLIQEPIIMSDVHLLVAIHTWFLFPHFKWSQLGDPDVGGTPSFMSRHMLVRYFLMVQQIEDGTNENWMQMDDFKGFVDSMQTLDISEKNLQKEKVKHFLRIVRASLIKHFCSWVSADLLFLSLFSEKETAQIVAKLVLGMEQEEAQLKEDFVSKAHGQQINLQKFANFVQKQCTAACITTVASSPFVQENQVAIRLLSQGGNIWTNSTLPPLLQFKHLYQTRYAALPINSQFTKRGVKESSYVTLGRRSEKNRSILSTARAKLVPDAMIKGRSKTEREDGEKRGVQGKLRTQVLMDEVAEQQREINNLQQRDNDSFQKAYSSVYESLTCNKKQFKKERIDKKVSEYKKKEQSTTTRGQRTQHQKKYDLTPLLEGKIQYAKMLRKHNNEQVRNECDARNLTYLPTTNWTKLLNLIKADEGDKKYFKPKTDYDAFKWNETHYNQEE